MNGHAERAARELLRAAGSLAEAADALVLVAESMALEAQEVAKVTALESILTDTPEDPDPAA